MLGAFTNCDYGVDAANIFIEQRMSGSELATPQGNCFAEAYILMVLRISLIFLTDRLRAS